MHRERLYTLKEAKQLLGVTTRTIQKWDKQSKLRVARTAGGRRRIPESEIKRLLNIPEQREIIGYTRVSQASQRNDLQRQMELLKQQGITKILTDIGSGLKRKTEKLPETPTTSSEPQG